MAQTQHVRPVDSDESPVITMTMADFSAIASSLGYDTHGGLPVIHDDGELASVPFPTAAALVKALLQNTRNYAHQTPNGTSLQDDVTAYATSVAKSMPSCSAFNAVFKDALAPRVHSALTVGVPQPDGSTLKYASAEGDSDADKKLFASFIESAMANPANREKYFQPAIESAFASGQVKADAKEKKKRTAKVSTIASAL